MSAEMITSEELAIEVVTLSKGNNITLLEALTEVVGKYDLDINDIQSYISKPLRAKLEAECTQLGMLKEKQTTKRLF